MPRRIATLVTTLGADDAEAVARTLLDERLVACVQADAVVSRYRWRGAVETAAETRLTMKTAEGLVGPLVARLGALHPYDVPQISWSCVAATESYADWVEAETR